MGGKEGERGIGYSHCFFFVDILPAVYGFVGRTILMHHFTTQQGLTLNFTPDFPMPFVILLFV